MTGGGLPGPASVNYRDVRPPSSNSVYDQNGGSAPVNSIDPVPIRHQIEEVWDEPLLWRPGQAQAPVVGGGNGPAVTEGSNINQATFSVPSMNSEPYVVANPYVSPAMLPKEMTAVEPNPAAPATAGAVQTQPVSSQLISEVSGTVRQGGGLKSPKKGSQSVVFDSDEIKVIKLE